MSDKLEKGTFVTVNIPFSYEIGQEGYFSGKLLETIQDCEDEVYAELENRGMIGESFEFDISTH